MTDRDNIFEFAKINNSRDKIDCVLIGEIHFFTQEQVWQLAEIFDGLNIPVICYGLHTNYLGHPFEIAALLLAIEIPRRGQNNLSLW